VGKKELHVLELPRNALGHRKGSGPARLSASEELGHRIQ
jgi:hypothetical protein